MKRDLEKRIEELTFKNEQLEKKVERMDAFIKNIFSVNESLVKQNTSILEQSGSILSIMEKLTVNMMTLENDVTMLKKENEPGLLIGKELDC